MHLGPYPHPHAHCTPTAPAFPPATSAVLTLTLSPPPPPPPLQDIELYLTKKEVRDGFDLVARIGNQIQELHVATTLSRDEMKAAVRRVIKRVVQLDSM
jgi:hypothetical protein